MSSPYQPEPGCTAMQRQLEQQVHDLRQQLRAAEKELGERRGQERREQQLEAAWRSTIVEARRQAVRADTAEAGLAIADEHIARGNEATNRVYAELRSALQRAADAEAKLAELTVPCLVPPPSPLGFDRIGLGPCIVTGPHTGHRDADGATWWKVHSGCTGACSEGHTYQPPCEQTVGQIITLPPQPVRPGPMYWQPCTASACPTGCAEGHRYEGDCLLNPLNPRDIGSITYLGSGRGLWAWSCEGHEWCEGVSSSDYETAAVARRAHDRHVKRWHTQDEP